MPQPRNMRSSTNWITLWTPCTPPPRQKATDDALDQINSLDASYVSTQSILQREIAQNYTTAAQSYNTMASGFPANVIGTLWGAGQVELYAAQ